VRLHGARTGDYDALLAFWEVVAWVSFFQYLETSRPRHLYWLGAALTAAVLTKGVAGLLGGPALLAYVLGRGKLGWLLRQPRLYAVAAASLATIAAYYLARESVDPGYWAAVRENELGGRFNQVLDGHSGPWRYYFSRLYQTEFAYWVWWLLPAGLVWLQPDRLVRRAGGLLLVAALSWLLLISSAATKLEWYGLPAYPPLALLTGLGLDFFYHDLLALNLPRLPRALAWPLRVGLVLLLFYFPFRAIMRQLIDERRSDFGLGPDAHLARYVGEVVREQPALDSLTLLSKGGYNPVLQYYRTALGLSDHKTIAVRYGGEARLLRPGTVVLVCDPAYRARLDSLFQLVTMHQQEPCETVLLLPRK